MKMGNHFALPVRAERRDIYGADGWYAADCSNSEEASAAAHAINCHDELAEALRPFAELAEARDKAAVAYLRGTDEAASKNASDTELAALFAPDSDVVITDGALVSPRAVTWGAFRRARTALAKAKGE